jgi:hypothetical protein
VDQDVGGHHSSRRGVEARVIATGSNGDTAPTRDAALIPIADVPRWFFRNPKTGELVIAQRPNLPLAIFLVATLVRLAFEPEGAVGTAVSVVAALGLVWWALEEIVRGDSPFRRVLGGVVLVAFVVGRLMR